MNKMGSNTIKRLKLKLKIFENHLENAVTEKQRKIAQEKVYIIKNLILEKENTK